MMRLYLNGIGVLGPGLVGWPHVQRILAGTLAYDQSLAIPDPTPTCLKPNELRRSSHIVRWSLTVAQEAIEQAQSEPQNLATIFSSSGGETDILHNICLSLCEAEPVLSPTLFHHSVHNAAAGYWSIAVQSQQPSISLSCYDSSFCGGLLEAAVFCTTQNTPALLVSYDLPPPHPLFEARPLVNPFAIALVMSSEYVPQSLSTLDVTLHHRKIESSNRMTNDALERLRLGNPAARALPLLAGLAQQQDQKKIILDYLDDQQLALEINPCLS
ncbi:MAG: hypothetical protein NPIRA04_16890 [Nitrospirales bacterium]|nr:MAG: hypothetical protein NPIRA04_16890 [Nitrospirales bacterium]